MSKFAGNTIKWMVIAIIVAFLSSPSMAMPGLNLTKTCSTISANIDDTIVYSFELKNNGTEKLSNPKILDDHLGEVKVDKSTLNVGESYVLSVSYKVVQSDLPGPLVNIARGIAEHKGGEVFSNNASCAVSLGIVGYENLTKYGYAVPELLNRSAH